MTSRRFQPLALAITTALSLHGHAWAQAPQSDKAPEAAANGDQAETASAKLDTVEVVGFRSEQMSGSKYSRELQDTPRIITVLPEDLLLDQGVRTLKDALRNQPGISLQAGEGNPPGGDQLKIRGFNARDDINVNGARDVGNYFRDPFFVDQIEIVKGPNSTFSGRGSTGGTINFVTKLPRPEDSGAVELSVGGSDLARTTIDLNRRINDDSAVRINLMGHGSNVPGRDVAEEKRHGLYAAYLWGFGGDTQLSADLLHLRQNDIPDAGLPFDRDPAGANSRGTGALPPGLDFDNFYGHVNDYKDVEASLLGLTAQHTFGNGVFLRNQLRLSKVSNDSITSSPRIRAIPATSPGFQGAQVRGETKPRDQVDRGYSNQTSVGFSFLSGTIAHDVVTGVEVAGYSYENKRRPDVAGPQTSLYAPLPRNRPATPYDGTVYRLETEELAFYALDTVALSPQWDLHLGMRWDQVQAEASERGRENLPTPGDNRRLTRTDDVTSGSVGLVYKLSPATSVYASVGTSFDVSGNFDRNQIQLAGGATARVADSATFNIAPERTTAFELGAKWLVAEDLAINAAVFRTQKDRARFPGQAGGDNSILDSKLRVEGFELLVAGKLTPEWQVYGGYAYLDGEVLSAPSRPFAVGQDLGGTPRHSATVFTTYQLTPELSLGGGVQYVDEQFGSVQATATGTVKTRIPAYTVTDLYAAWRFNAQWETRLNVLNANDERYISQLAEGGGQGIPGPGRQIMATVRYDF